jgi:multiple sugar transport system substrate-binding protein
MLDASSVMVRLSSVLLDVGRTVLSVCAFVQRAMTTDRIVRSTVCLFSMSAIVIAAEPKANVALRVLVVNDLPLSEAIGRLKGEWAERFDGSLTVDVKAWADLADAKSLDADLIVFPTRYLGELCTRGWLRPVRAGVLEGKSLDVDDIFPLARRELVTWGGYVMALPLGVDVPVMSYRTDFYTGSTKLPDTWSSYLKPLVEDRGKWERATEPYARVPLTWEPWRSWGGVMLLARAAAYGIRPDDRSLLFDATTMKPRITEPPFVRALDELQQLATDEALLQREPSTEVERKAIDPRMASCATAKGEPHRLAIGLPPAGHRQFTEEHVQPIFPGSDRIGWTQLPGADEVYHASSKDWEKQAKPHRVPVLGVGDRLVAVTASSKNAASAFKLLGWLASAEISTQLAAVGDRTMPVRGSLASSAAWYDPTVNASERADLAKVLQASLSHEEYFIVPRIPGVDEYMLALDEAVEDVIFEKAEPAAALEKAAKHWELVTERLGRDAQRNAYLKHLGNTE